MSRIQRTLVRAALGLAAVTSAVALWYRSAYVFLPGERLSGYLPIPKVEDSLLAANPTMARNLVGGHLPCYFDIGPYYFDHAEFRFIAERLGWASDARAESGRLSEAVDCAMDAVALGAVPLPGESTGPGLTGFQCEGSGLGALWQIADRLDAPAARSTVQRLARIDAQRWTFAAHMAQERQDLLAFYREFYAEGPDGRLRGALREAVLGDPRSQSPEPFSSRIAGLGRRVIGIYYGPKPVQRNLDVWVDATVERARAPWGLRGPLPPIPNDPANSYWLRERADADFQWTQVRANAGLLRTYLALRAYRLERGTYPASLEELTRCGYLASVPVDSFSPTCAPLRYRRNADKTMVLWSVGPDAKDDSGQPIARVNLDSVGDIVARANHG